MAVLPVRLRPCGARTVKPQPEAGAPKQGGTAKGASDPTPPEHADYQWVVNVAAGVVTLSAGVLGVFGVTGGAAVALLRNAPEAVATASLAAGVAVLLGVASAFISPELTQRQHLRATRQITILTAALVVAALVTTGIEFTSRGAPSVLRQVLWWLFLAGIGVLMLWGARVVAFKARGYPLKTLAILASLAVFGVSVLCVVVLAAGQTRMASRPAVSVTLDFKSATANTATTAATTGANSATTSPRDSFVLHVTVKSLGMRSDERYLVAVDRVDQPIDATQVREVYRTYVGPDAAGNVQYAFSIPLDVDSVVPWLGVSATLQGAGEPPTDPRDHCGVETRASRVSGSTCALVYADPTLTSS